MSHTKRITQERDRYRELALEMEFRLKQAERRNIEHENDYLAVWKAIKEPNETLLDSCKRVVRERDELRYVFEQEYLELLMAVESKHAGETRHQTALRYITEREASGASESDCVAAGTADEKPDGQAENAEVSHGDSEIKS